MSDSSDDDGALANDQGPSTRPSLDRLTPEQHATDPSELSERGMHPGSLDVPVSYERRSTDPDVGTRVSSARARREPRTSGETTLLSAPAPADPREIEIDDRLDDHNRRLAELDERVDMLTRALARLEKPAAKGRASWLVWVGFLLLLALLWQLQQWLR